MPASSSPHARRRVAGITGVCLAALGLILADAPCAAARSASAPDPAGTARASHLTAAQVRRYAATPSRRVIVILKDQFRGELGSRAAGPRADEVSRAQQGIRAELMRLHAPGLRQYRFLDALAATVSPLEADRLAADPAVLAVVPDRTIRLPRPTGQRSTTPAATPRDAVNRTPGLCGTAAKPLQEPEALRQIGAEATYSGITGKGVRIAVFPDGLNPEVPDFIRADGTHAIFDYQDFTGDGPLGATGGAEAFGDASSIIAQGRVTYDLSTVVNPKVPLPPQCDIRIKGVAPGASLAVMKVIGAESGSTSTVLQGLDHAVSVDHVDVLSESFGSNPVPNPANDPVALFNDLAIAHGITVVASSGDAGVANTIGTPAASTGGVISTGAVNSYRLHAQLSQDGYQVGGRRGWVNDNIATLSSGGFTDYGPNSVDVVAPGDSNWAVCSRAISIFHECAGQFGGSAKAPGAFPFGGTSEACPLTAATAALVIQAYRATHDGTTPTPQTVKKIIMSSADDLHMPVNEQGAGRVNARRAVQLARSYSTRTPTGVTAVFAPAKITTVTAPGATNTRTVYVHNTSATTRTITPGLRTFGAARSVAGGTFTYPGNSAPQLTYWRDGSSARYVERDIDVPSGYQRLNVRFGFPGDDAADYVLYEVLFDPSGRLVQDSNPSQQTQGFGQGDVRNPRAGRWRAIFFAYDYGDAFRGPITWQATVQRRVATGSVTPTRLVLRPGAVGAVTVRYSSPATAGDSAAEVIFGSRIGVLPILTRAYATPKVGAPATVAGELTTGNGRMAVPSQELPFQFSVPAGVRDVDVDVHVSRPGYRVVGFLDAPNAAPVEVAGTTFLDVTRPTPASIATQDLHLSWQRPTPGRWGLVLATEGGASSGSVATAVTGTISFDTARVTSAGVPDTATAAPLAVGAPVTASVTVTNTGRAPKIYFIDPRRDGQTTYPLPFAQSASTTLPVPPGGTPQALVPPGSTSLTMIAHLSAPGSLTMAPDPFGTPEIAGTTGRTAVASYTTGYIPTGAWDCNAALDGPYSEPGKGGRATCEAFASTDTIDRTVRATGGNLWDTITDHDATNTYDRTHAVVVAPGDSTTLTVTFTPWSADAGTTVRGYLAVQSLDAVVLSGDDVAHIPYTYRVSSS